MREGWTYKKWSDVLSIINGKNQTAVECKGSEIFRYLINDDTIDNVLSELMENGLKIKSGEDIGKTIIFAGGYQEE